MKGTRKYQGGAETVEFAITLMLWFTVFFLIIDIAVAFYDKGAIVNAARYGARQGGLYWVDPDPLVYDETDPQGNHGMKEAMISTAVNYLTSNTVITPSGSSVVPVVNLDGLTVAPNAVVMRIADQQGNVALSYTHSYIGLTGLLGAVGLTLDASTGFDMEASFE